MKNFQTGLKKKDYSNSENHSIIVVSKKELRMHNTFLVDRLQQKKLDKWQKHDKSWKHESMDLTCLLSKAQAGVGDVMLLWKFSWTLWVY